MMTGAIPGIVALPLSRPAPPGTLPRRGGREEPAPFLPRTVLRPREEEGCARTEAASREQDRPASPRGRPDPHPSILQAASSAVGASTSMSSLGPGIAGVEVNRSHLSFTLSAGSAVIAYISLMNWWSRARK